MPSVEVVGRQLLSSDEQKELVLVAVTQYICFCTTVQFVYFRAFYRVSYVTSCRLLQRGCTIMRNTCILLPFDPDVNLLFTIKLYMYC